MKKRIIAALLALTVLTGVDVVSAAGKDPGGALDFKWSQDEKGCLTAGVCVGEALALERGAKGETVYSGATSPRFGVPVFATTYGFFKGKAYLATIVFAEPATAYKEALPRLMELYGAPSSAGKTSATWVMGNTRLTLYQGENQVAASFGHLPVLKEVAKLKGFPEKKAKGK
jgi:hypothetical protein